MEASDCPRCLRSLSADEGEVSLRGRKYHQACGALEIWEVEQRHIRVISAQARAEAVQRLGAFHEVRHPPPLAETQPAHVCKESGLIHSGGQHISISTRLVLERWYSHSAHVLAGTSIGRCVICRVSCRQRRLRATTYYTLSLIKPILRRQTY